MGECKNTLALKRWRIASYASLLLSLIALGACTPNTTEPSDDATQQPSLQYRCDNGEMLVAQYINEADKQSALLKYQNREFNMYSVRAASGASYATEQGLAPEEGLMWRTQKDEGLLIKMILDHTVSAEDYPIITRCVVNVNSG
ncbi:MliC family protein [Ningiella sp. W23]|uniref:MliC family protein n=1 Tax=Ningiella sp. W23 TaxID=3023715 RepID=UPI0037573156